MGGGMNDARCLLPFIANTAHRELRAALSQFHRTRKLRLSRLRRERPGRTRKISRRAATSRSSILVGPRYLSLPLEDLLKLCSH